MSLKHFVAQETASALRSFVEFSQYPGDPKVAGKVIDVLNAAGIFQPIERSTAPGSRASCRLCGELIEQGASVIKFGLDPYRAARGGFGQLTAALIHAEFCSARKEEE